MYEVYLITNSVNDKKYVGITRCGVSRRFNEHLSAARNGSRKILHCAIRKYGAENFSYTILESEIAERDICEKERYYIALHDTYYKNRHGYNMTIGGNGTIGYVFTKEVRAKISLANKGRVYTPERNERIRKAFTGRRLTPEWKAALSKSRMGHFTGNENPFYGKHHSDETKGVLRDKISNYIVYRLNKETFDVLESYTGGMEAARWVVRNGLGKNPETCNGRILLVCRHTDTMTAYGYRWKFEKKCID